MTKKGPLGKAEVFYIESFFWGINPQQHAQELYRGVYYVKKEFKRLENLKDSEPITAGSQFARRDGVVTMTENASAVSDANRKVSDNLSRSCISRIKKNE
jgi:hypothetical protein